MSKKMKSLSELKADLEAAQAAFNAAQKAEQIKIGAAIMAATGVTSLEILQENFKLVPSVPEQAPTREGGENNV